MDDFLGLFAEWVERMSLLQICNQRIRSGLIFKSMRQFSNYPCSLTLGGCSVWGSLRSEVDLELLLTRNWFPNVGKTR